MMFTEGSPSIGTGGDGALLNSSVLYASTDAPYFDEEREQWWLDELMFALCFA